VDVAVTGSRGLIASKLIPALQADGHRALRLVRDTPKAATELHWDPAAGTIDAGALEGVDAVVHLAGAGIGDKKWTPERKQLVLDSRTQGTGLLARTLAGLDRKPSVLISASAIGYYGDRGDKVLTEAAGPGDDFGARVCREWEAATAPASDAGIRVVCIRSGLVQAASGGMLQRLLLPFRLGIGGRLGSGEQYMSWIAIDDEVAAILHAMTTQSLSGPVNLTAPQPVTNSEYTATLGRVLHRPTVLPTPLVGLKAVYGSELVATLLGSQRVASDKLQASGYQFAFPELEGALRAVLHA
jgi:uncharacterized protein (TIGR01777 family)